MQYYNKRSHYWASDVEEKCIEGDIVLIDIMKEPQSDRVKHTIEEIVFKVGQTVDPITMRRCRGPQFTDKDIQGLNS